MRITAVPEPPPVVGYSWADRWLGPDQGLLLTYARGLRMRSESPGVAARAMAGELPVLPWRGGVEKPLRSGVKLGSVYYLAMWQGLRGDCLDVSLSHGTLLVCTRTGQPVQFVPDLLERMQTQPEDDDGDA